MNHEIMMYGEHSASEASQWLFSALVSVADLVPLFIRRYRAKGAARLRRENHAFEPAPPLPILAYAC